MIPKWDACIEELSKDEDEALEQCRQAELIVKKTVIMLIDEYPVLYSAMKLLQPKEYAEDKIKISTDGEYLLYSTPAVLGLYLKHGYSAIKYQIMHVLLHCILGHLEMNTLYRDKKLLWVAMDRQVYHILENLKLIPRYIYEWECMEEYLGNCYDIGCYYLAKSNSATYQKMLRDGKELVCDNHRFWNRKKTGADAAAAAEAQKRFRQVCEKWKAIGQSLMGEAADGEKLVKLLNQSKAGEQQGMGAGEDCDKVKAAAANENSYYHVLMRFFKMKEDNRELPDAIDTMLYQYGLELYGDVPLIEPPETEEQLKLSTICVAVDTSGSCSGEDACKFLRETYNLLRDISRLAPGCEFYFFQCDWEIQKEEHFERAEDILWKEWEEMDMFGWGGTSFIPVFERVDELIEKEEKTIDCLIYLTDSYGDWPEEKPEYPVFFILPQPLIVNGCQNYDCDLPEWIEVTSLEEDK